MSEKRQGALCHCSVIVSYRLGAGGNLITPEQWAAFENERAAIEDTDMAATFKNPFMVFRYFVISHMHMYIYFCLRYLPPRRCGQNAVATPATGVARRWQINFDSRKNFGHGG